MLYTSGVLDEFSELPTTPEHYQTVVNQGDEFAASSQPTITISKFVREYVLFSTQRISWRRKLKSNKDKVMKFPKR